MRRLLHFNPIIRATGFPLSCFGAHREPQYTSAEQMGRLHFSEVEITRLSPDTAVALGRWELKCHDDHPRGRFTLLFQRLPEGWRIIHDHTSAATP